MRGMCDQGDSASDEEATAAKEFPLHMLPDLPARGDGYWSEPLLGAFVVTALCALFIGVTNGVTAAGDADSASLRTILRWLVVVEAFVAGSCVLYLLKLENAGQIQRSREACYPIPAEVEHNLREGTGCEGMRNVPGAQGSSMHGRTYCVRCLVWRPPKAEKPHHCNTCQRCVVGFDHHCGVFGRCIVNGNMPCFYTLIGMFFAGMGTTMAAVAAASPSLEVAT